MHLSCVTPRRWVPSVGIQSSQADPIVRALHMKVQSAKLSCHANCKRLWEYYSCTLVICKHANNTGSTDACAQYSQLCFKRSSHNNYFHSLQNKNTWWVYKLHFDIIKMSSFFLFYLTNRAEFTLHTNGWIFNDSLRLLTHNVHVL